MTDAYDATRAAGSTVISWRKNEWAGTVPPTATDDADSGYEAGSRWFDTVTQREWVCFVATVGSAVWLETTAGSLHVDLTVTGAHTIDRDDGETHDLTMTGDPTFTLAGAFAGRRTDLALILRQDATGSRTVTWPGTITWAGGSAPTLQTAANAVDTIGLVSVDDGATWFGYFDQTGSSLTAASTVEAETSFGISSAVGTDTEYARQDHTHGTPADPVTAAAVKALGRWEPVQFDDGSSPWPFVYYDDEIVVAWVATP